MFWQCISLASILYSATLSPGAPVQRNPVFSGTVIEVMEGDVIKVRTKDWGDYKVRLWGVDAPELKQPFGKESKKYLQEMILKKSVVVSVYQELGGPRGVNVSWVTSNSPDSKGVVNEKMVATGHAWWGRLPDNRELRSEASALMKAEESAKKSKVGLWSKANRSPRGIGRSADKL